MLRGLLKYGAVAAKTAAIRSKRLSQEDYNILSHMSSVPEVASYLKNNTCYSDILKNVNERELHRADLELILYKYCENIVSKLYAYVTGDEKKFLDIYFLRQEIKIMKDILIRIMAGMPYMDSHTENELFNRKYNINVEKLAQSNNITEFIEVLRGTEYERILEPILNIKEHHNLFSVIMTLDTYYFKKLWQLKDKYLKNKDKKLITHTLGSEIDILNIMCIYRSKRYYSIPNELIYSYLLPIYYRIGKNTIAKMVEDPNPDEMLKIAEKTPYRNVFNRKEIDNVDINSERFVDKIHYDVIKKHPWSISNVIAQIHLIETEVRNIINIIEGVRYKVPAESIKNMINYQITW